MPTCVPLAASPACDKLAGANSEFGINSDPTDAVFNAAGDQTQAAGRVALLAFQVHCLFKTVVVRRWTALSGHVL
jgi:hypothetical protein